MLVIIMNTLILSKAKDKLCMQGNNIYIAFSLQCQRLHTGKINLIFMHKNIHTLENIRQQRYLTRKSHHKAEVIAAGNT